LRKNEMRFHLQLNEALEPLKSDDVFMSGLVAHELRDLSGDQLRKIVLAISKEAFNEYPDAAVEPLLDILMNGFRDTPYKEMSREELMREIADHLEFEIRDAIEDGEDVAQTINFVREHLK